MTQIEEIKDKVRRIKSCRSKLNNLMMFLSENNLEGIEVELKLPQENELQITVWSKWYRIMVWANIAPLAKAG